MLEEERPRGWEPPRPIRDDVAAVDGADSTYSRSPAPAQPWLQPWARPVLAKALALAGEGLAVLPVARNKCPACPHGLLQASRDPIVVQELWERWGGPLIGVATGSASGINVLDLDTTRHAEALTWFKQNRHRIPATRAHRTRAQGIHLLFRHAEGLRNSAGKIAVGVDVRAERGYVIWWPLAGLDVMDSSPVAPWPQWLLDQLKQQQAKEAATRAASITPGMKTSISHNQLAGLVRTIAGANEGRRNNALYWASCRIAERGADGFAIAVLEEAARRAGLDAREISSTIQSALKRCRS